jgi:hypothetical protein
MINFNSARRIDSSTLHVDNTPHPDWIPASERLPKPGEEVYCTGGPAELVKVLGKTGNGSRLLELKRPGEKHPFFAAATNVLVAPQG